MMLNSVADAREYEKLVGINDNPEAAASLETINQFAPRE